jgi:hypothetical protein
MKKLSVLFLLGLTILLLVINAPVVLSKSKYNPTRNEVLSYALPNSQLTPGLADSAFTAKEICAGKYPKRKSQQSAVFKRYDIPKSKQKNYIIDHLISVQLGGSSDLRNLWPQLKKESYVKDKLEDRLKENICGGSLTLQQAQSLESQDWKAAYIKNFIDKKPLP